MASTGNASGVNRAKSTAKSTGKGMVKPKVGQPTQSNKMTSYYQPKGMVKSGNGPAGQYDEEMKDESQFTDQQVIQYHDVAPDTDFTEELLKSGYMFHGEEGVLKTVNGDALPKLSQGEFEQLGDTVIGHVQQTMKLHYKMNEVWLPADDSTGPKANIFLSQDFYTNKNKCLVLIQGTGAVRAGIWARSVCINNSLQLGSVFPMLEFAKSNGFSVIVLNPNMSYDPISKQEINCSRTMGIHCKYVWEHFMKTQCPAKKLAIIAHSAGGRCVDDLYQSFRQDLTKRVTALVFTDAYYHTMFNQMSHVELTKMKNIGIHFKAFQKGYKEVGEPFKTQRGPILEVSAGTETHAMTTGVSTPAIIDFIMKKVKLES